MNTKECFKCGAEKPLTDFYKHSQMHDGHVNKCKECNKKDVRENRSEKVNYYRQYDVDRYQNDPRVRDRREKYHKQWKIKNPEKHKAHCAVSNAIRDGKLFRRPCEICGTEKNVHAHHDDYSKPLSVRWLCAAHHRQHHLESD